MESETTPAAAVSVPPSKNVDDGYETASETEDLEGNARECGSPNFILDEKDEKDEKEDKVLSGGSSQIGVEGESKAEDTVGLVQDENFGGDGESEAVEANPVLEVEDDVKFEDTSVVVAEEEKDGDAVISVPNRDFGEVADLKPVEVQYEGVDGEEIKDAVDSKLKLDEDGESKDIEEEFNAFEGKEKEKVEADVGLDRGLEMENGETKAVSDSETIFSGGGVVLNPVEDVEPPPTLSEVIKSREIEIELSENLGVMESTVSLEKVELDAEADPSQSLKMENGEIKAVFDPETKFSDGVFVLDPVEDVHPPPTLAEETKNREIEIELTKDLGFMVSSVSIEKVEPDANGSYVVVSDENSTHNEPKEKEKEKEEKVTTLDCSVESSFPVSIEKVQPNADGSHVADDDENPTKNEKEDEEEGYGKIANLETSVENPLPISVAVEKVEPDADEIPTKNEASREEGEEEDLKNNETEIDDQNPTKNEEEEDEEDAIISTQQPRIAILDSSETAKQIIKEMEEGSSSTSYGSSRDFHHQMDGQVISDSDEDDTDEENDGKELFDSAALAALLKAATGASSDGNISFTSQDGTRVFSVDRPAGLGSSAPSLRPVAPRSTRPTLFGSSELATSENPEDEMNEEERKVHEKVEDIRVKFLRLVMRLGHTPEDSVAAQVLYRLNLAEGMKRRMQMGRVFNIESAKKKAIQLENNGEKEINFSCNILVLGKTGVGKSATINSIFGEEKSQTNAFIPATFTVREISGVVDGVKIRVLDTPGLKSSVMDQGTNRRILSSIKKYMKKCPPDIVLYVDRLDSQTRDFNDLPLLRSITSALGSSIWFNVIVALTHAGSAPPEGPNGSPLNYENFIAQRSHVVQHSIRQAVGDMRLMNPVAFVENHPSCRRNREGERVLPNGLSWRPQMLLLCYSSEILSEANSLLKLQESNPSKLFGLRFRTPPLPYLLSMLLQSRPHPKLCSDQGGDNGDSDIDVDDFSDAEEEEEDDYDLLPPFKPLKKSQIAMLTKEQRRAYFDEYDYRVKLLQKKLWKDELRRMKEMKKRGKVGSDNTGYNEMGDDFDQDGAPAAVSVPLPDMILPPSFHCDLPTYRYRFLEPNSQLLTRPVLDTHGWDHDCGYDGVSLEQSLAIASKFPASVAVQITKDKKEFNIHLDSSVSAKHGEIGSTLAGFDIQSVGKQLAYILRSETKFKNFKTNKTTGGISVIFLGENVATGLKVEDQLTIVKRVSLVASTGAMRSQGEVAYGANLEARLREKDYPIGQPVSTLGLSLMKWRGDLALGANLQSQVSIGRSSKVAVRVGLNNKLSGQITVRTSSSEYLQLALVGIVPVALSIYRNIWPGESDLVH